MRPTWKSLGKAMSIVNRAIGKAWLNILERLDTLAITEAITAKPCQKDQPGRRTNKRTSFRVLWVKCHVIRLLALCHASIVQQQQRRHPPLAAFCWFTISICLFSNCLATNDVPAKGRANVANQSHYGQGYHLHHELIHELVMIHTLYYWQY